MREAAPSKPKETRISRISQLHDFQFFSTHRPSELHEKLNLPFNMQDIKVAKKSASLVFVCFSQIQLLLLPCIWLLSHLHSRFKKSIQSKKIIKEMKIGCPLLKKREWRNLLLRSMSSVLLCKNLGQYVGIYRQKYLKREV